MKQVRAGVHSARHGVKLQIRLFIVILGENAFVIRTRREVMRDEGPQHEGHHYFDSRGRYMAVEAKKNTLVSFDITRMEGIRTQCR